jgi:membrane protein
VRNLCNNISKCLYKAAVNTINHDGVEHAGYMAFLAILTLFPFLVFIIALAGFIGDSQLGVYFVDLLFKNLPQDVTQALEPRVKEIISGPPQGLLTLAIVGAIWTASSAVEGLRTILNRVYRVITPPAYIWRRLLSIIQFLILTGIIIISTSVLVVSPLLIERIEPLLAIVSKHGIFWNYLRYISIYITLFFVVAILYYVIPNVKLKFISVVPGAALVVALWLAGGMLLSSYISNFKQVSLIYGSLGGIIASLLFFYIINMIFIYGAEFNYLLSKSFKKDINRTSV